MGIFNRVNKKAAIVEKSKANTRGTNALTYALTAVIYEEERKINDAYCQIGKLCVEMHLHDNSPDFDALISSIAESKEKIRAAEIRIQEGNGLVQCGCCGAMVDNKMRFCTSCGKQLTETAQEVVKSSGDCDKLKLCPLCGAKNKNDMNYCTTCGGAFENVTKDEPLINEYRCQICGAMQNEDSLFCATCGASTLAPIQKSKPKEAIRDFEAPNGSVADTALDESKQSIHDSENRDIYSSTELEKKAGLVNDSEKRCPSCGAKADEGSLFCFECGTRL